MLQSNAITLANTLAALAAMAAFGGRTPKP
jgi:hypothetical protein